MKLLSILFCLLIPGASLLQSDAPPSKPVHPRVTVYVFAPNWCTVCAKMKDEAKDTERYQFHFIDDEWMFPEGVHRKGVFPYIHFRINGHRHHTTGWRDAAYFADVFAGADGVSWFNKGK